MEVMRLIYNFAFFLGLAYREFRVGFQRANMGYERKRVGAPMPVIQAPMDGKGKSAVA